jgi:hypothetical protein
MGDHPSVFHMATLRARVTSLLVLCGSLPAAACSSPILPSTIPFGFTLTASPGHLIVEAGQVGVDTLTITSVNNFSGPVDLIPDSTVNCVIDPAEVVPQPSIPAYALSYCSRPSPGRSGMQFTAVSLGYQNAYTNVLLIQH